MDINRAYAMEQDRIEDSDMDDDEKREAQADLDQDMRDQHDAMEAEHDEVNRRYGY